MNVKTFRLLVTAVFLLVVIPVCLFAQPGGPGGDSDPQVPIDGGLSLLIAAGVGYAAKKAHDKRKMSKTDNEQKNK